MSRPVPVYQVDAFTDRLFSGNPAAVVLLPEWIDEGAMQAIAAENNLSETAFLVPSGTGRWGLRWFTPKVEVPLCGHATLASAFVLAELQRENSPALIFQTKSGELTVRRGEDGWYAMRFPVRPRADDVDPQMLADVLGAPPLEIASYRAGDDDSWLARLSSEAEVRAAEPDLRALSRLAPRNLIVTAPGEDVDFVSRVFAPKVGIDEDPVTGSAHCSLAPYWAEPLGKSKFQARQVSARGGDLRCELDGEHVIVSGRAVLYLEGRIHLPD